MEQMFHHIGDLLQTKEKPPIRGIFYVFKNPNSYTIGRSLSLNAL